MLLAFNSSINNALVMPGRIFPFKAGVQIVSSITKNKFDAPA